MAQLDGLSYQRLTNSSGTPLVSAKIYYWSDVGVSTPLATYSNASLGSANTQPVVTDANGAVGAVYLQQKRYWRTVTTSAGVSVPEYNAGPIDAVLTFISSATEPSPTYFPMRWHDTSTGDVKRRNAANNAWINEGNVDSLLNAASVTEQLTGTSAAKSSTPDSVAALVYRGTDITPTAGAVSLPSTGGGVFNIAAGNFSSISSAQGGRTVWFKYAGASTITHNATSMVLIGGANRTTAAGDLGCYINEAAADASGSNWREFAFFRADGSGPGVVATQAQMEAASNLTFPVTPGAVNWHPGVGKFWVKSTANSTTVNASHNVTSVADTATGRMTVTIATDFASADWCCHVTTAEAGTGGCFPSVEAAGQAAGTVVVCSRDAAANLGDPTYWHVSGFGDQA